MATVQWIITVIFVIILHLSIQTRVEESGGGVIGPKYPDCIQHFESSSGVIEFGFLQHLTNQECILRVSVAPGKKILLEFIPRHRRIDICKSVMRTVSITDLKTGRLLDDVICSEIIYIATSQSNHVQIKWKNEMKGKRVTFSIAYNSVAKRPTGTDLEVLIPKKRRKRQMVYKGIAVGAPLAMDNEQSVLSFFRAALGGRKGSVEFDEDGETIGSYNDRQPKLQSPTPGIADARSKLNNDCVFEFTATSGEIESRDIPYTHNLTKCYWTVTTKDPLKAIVLRVNEISKFGKVTNEDCTLDESNPYVKIILINLQEQEVEQFICNNRSVSTFASIQSLTVEVQSHFGDENIFRASYQILLRRGIKGTSRGNLTKDQNIQNIVSSATLTNQSSTITNVGKLYEDSDPVDNTTMLDFYNESTQCGGIIYQIPGIVQTPLHPKLYPSYTTCLWTILSPNEENIVLKFLQFDLSGPDELSELSCDAFQSHMYSYLRIYFYNREGEIVVETFCKTSQPDLIVSFSNRLSLYFIGGKERKKGFLAEYSLLSEFSPKDIRQLNFVDEECEVHLLDPMGCIDLSDSASNNTNACKTITWFIYKNNSDTAKIIGISLQLSSLEIKDCDDESAILLLETNSTSWYFCTNITDEQFSLTEVSLLKLKSTEVQIDLFEVNFLSSPIIGSLDMTVDSEIESSLNAPESLELETKSTMGVNPNVCYVSHETLNPNLQNCKKVDVSTSGTVLLTTSVSSYNLHENMVFFVNADESLKFELTVPNNVKSEEICSIWYLSVIERNSQYDNGDGNTTTLCENATIVLYSRIVSVSLEFNENKSFEESISVSLAYHFLKSNKARAFHVLLPDLKSVATDNYYIGTVKEDKLRLTFSSQEANDDVTNVYEELNSVNLHTLLSLDDAHATVTDSVIRTDVISEATDLTDLGTEAINIVPTSSPISRTESTRWISGSSRTATTQKDGGVSYTTGMTTSIDGQEYLDQTIVNNPTLFIVILSGVCIFLIVSIVLVIQYFKRCEYQSDDFNFSGNAPPYDYWRHYGEGPDVWRGEGDGSADVTNSQHKGSYRSAAEFDERLV